MTFKQITAGLVLVAVAMLLASSVTTRTSDISYNISDIPASLEVTSSMNTNIEVGDVQDITWNSYNYDSSVVGINIIKEVDTNPHRYELVRSLKGTISNDGKAVWVPTYKDIGERILVEVTCKNTLQACTSDVASSHIAVIDSNRYAAMAQAFESFEMLRNN